MKVQGKTIVVTGGGNGIGRELVLGLLSKGADVAAVDVDEGGLRETASLAGAWLQRLSLHEVDVTDQAAVSALVQAVIAKHGTVDGLINNAGVIQPFVRLSELGYAAIDRVMRINFFGTLYMTKEFLPYLLKRPEAHIVNISSMGGFLPVPGQTLYGASKAAVKLLTEGIHSELADSNVRVTVVFPGAVATDIAKRSGVTLPTPSGERGSAAQKRTRITSPREAARLIIAGMERNRYRVLIGRDAKLMDFLYRLWPKGAARLIYSQMKDLLPD